ncbi:hypothetical protein [Phaffia rhodozyma]|uniref:Uncharacterized protein n=1 Tax=Phaffia rhodozyma TaxID=264483 RepID=A0A0F7SS03_PHARH|nr:hypothetical protein [Phaffia rhodozyma]
MNLSSRPVYSLLRSSAQSGRAFSTSAAARSQPSVPLATPVPSPPTVGSIQLKKPIGAFRGAAFGFLLATSIASGFASWKIFEEYKQVTSLLQESVRELNVSVALMADHVKRIQDVERSIESVKQDSSSKADLSKLRAEFKKVFDGLRLEFLDAKTHLWGIEQDLGSLTKKNTIRLL